ncbi:Putative ATPase involved in DNA repair-like protein [Vibrio nigripulchritudo SFn27]|uniref:Putative ATPase involved in DNA repair-like protein n=1 Tax=Vibrio nigripulchritudo TaxID=28173 RepID=U4JZC0_9VIBR|nr:AAA family ATPase [Vibrio nigripulchritudo]CCN82730.1 Putative ATPase involved in DNA repair-like protein [Vibrio nigripulchritudo BLFn1]CCN89880.1 Putative ATPase involved in DNA repair-like protein [Vibrio nigripulchritudo SFn27]CCN92277.1 Putative ATPase involved in DNA repair-like protein [Vibrio nigripulchritudo ENn2]CCO43764.1 Putative ATPase involved in DNA repair-like protein [Vibrio nigripulchritudo SFn135]CCO53078.1 Putative ATPase involved in DNA repair-like protein [Vibrio nigri
MKLIKLEISNFRQFYGKQSIEFAVDPTCGVTLIHGENNGGKTALLNALRWCLYEETTENLLDPENLLNKHAAAEGTNTFTVSVQLEHENRLLEVKRVQIKKSSSSVLHVYEIEDGCYAERAEDNPNTLINTFLPKEMSQYFFYQGEGTGTLNSQNDFSHIKDAIEKVLGLTVAKTTLRHLSTVKTNYQKDLKQYDTNNQIETLLSNKDNLVSGLDRDKAQLEKKQNELESAEKEYEALVGQLHRFDKTAIEDKLKLRQQKSDLLTGYERDYKRLLSDKITKAPGWALSTYSQRLSSVDLTPINTEELNKSLRYTVDKQLLREIMDNNECICGSHVESGSVAEKLLEGLGKHAVDPELKRRWRLAVKLQEDLSNQPLPKTAMEQLLADIDDREDGIQELERNIKDLSHTIVESDIDDIKVIEKAKDSAKSKRDLLSREVPRLIDQIRKKQIDIKDIDGRIDSLSLEQPKAQKVRGLILATDKIIELYEDAISSSQQGVDQILLHKMQSLFRQVSFNGYTIKKDTSVKGGSFTWVIVDREDKRVAAGNGYQAMLSISFIVALIEFSKDRANNKQHLLTPGTIAPFIADSILAFIGPDNGRELVRYIAEKVEQSIFMFSQAQWTETHTDKGIRHKIGKEYNLVQHTVLTEEEFKGQYPTHLTVQGTNYDVVRFGSDFNKVTIEEIPTHG